MAEKPIVIRAYGPIRRIWTRVLILSMPFWLWVGISDWFNSWRLSLAECVFFVAVLSLVPLRQNRYVITAKFLKLPFPLRPAKIRFDKIKRAEVKMHDRQRYLLLKEKEVVWCPLWHLSTEHEHRLISGLEARGIKISKENWDQTTAPLSEEGHRIRYQPSVQLRQFSEALHSLEKPFLLTWCIVSLIPLFLCFSGILRGVLRRLGLGDPELWGESLGRDCMNFIWNTFNGLFDSSRSYFDLMSHPMLLSMTAIVSLSCAALALRQALRPNIIRLSPQGLFLVHDFLSKESVLTRIEWNTIVDVRLFKPNQTTDSSKWRIQIDTLVNGALRVVELVYCGLGSEAEKTRFISAIKSFAPQADIDVQLLEAFSTTNSHSYTELWLQSLSSPPSRSCFLPLSPETRLLDGRYRVKEQIGVGGQGTAYDAIDELSADSDRRVVLKEFILPTHTNEKIHLQALERFNHEAAVLERLAHPGIVQMKNYFVEDHRAYLVLERIDGQSLRTLSEGGRRFTPEEAADLLLQVCNILDYLHSRVPPIVHRDLTPDNLILRKDGSIKLIDFNVAHTKAQGASTATVVGKHAYLPAEQFRGQPTVRSDLYALGCTLFFILTGRDPEPLSQSSLSADFALAEFSGLLTKLDHIIRKCTELDERERFATANEIISFWEVPEKDVPRRDALTDLAFNDIPSDCQDPSVKCVEIAFDRDQHSGLIIESVKCKDAQEA